MDHQRALPWPRCHQKLVTVGPGPTDLGPQGDPQTLCPFQQILVPPLIYHNYHG